MLCPPMMLKKNCICTEVSGHKRSRIRIANGSEVVKPKGSGQCKPMILIYSPDMNFCFSLSSLFQDRYHIITTTDPELLGSLATIHGVSLVVIDDQPSRRMIERLREVRRVNNTLPLMMLYVYGPGDGDLDKTVRDHVDTVLYKPVNIIEISRRIGELIAG